MAELLLNFSACACPFRYYPPPVPQVVWPSIPCLRLPWMFPNNQTAPGRLPFNFTVDGLWPSHRFVLYGADPERDPAGAKCAYLSLVHRPCVQTGIQAMFEVVMRCNDPLALHASSCMV